MIPLISSSRLKIGSGTNIVWDGNSLFVGVPGANGNGIPAKAEEMAPILGSGATSTNLGVGGQTWRKMDGLDGGDASDVDGAYDDEADSNILILLESTNAAWAGRSGAQMIDDATTYIGNRRQAHAWTGVVLITPPPRLGDATQCGRLADFVDLARENYRAMGVDVLVDVRAYAGGLLDFLGTDVSQFNASSEYWHTDHVHFNETGADLVAEMVAHGLRRLRA